MSNIRKVFSASLIALTTASMLFSAEPSRAEPGGHGKGPGFTADTLPPGRLKSKIESLPAPARQRAIDLLNRFGIPTQDLEFIETDTDGGIFYTESAREQVPEEAPTSTGNDTPLDISVTDAFSLHSKPGASNVIFIDVDGHVLSGTAWNYYNGGRPLYAKAYDLDNDPSSFNAAELTNIAEIWHRLAEDFAPFDVDVTTEDPGTFGSTTARILITSNVDEYGNAMPFSFAGGVAYVGVWGLSGTYDYGYYSPALVYYNNLGGGWPPFVSEAATHEIGHNLALSHDGTSSVGYYTGHGSGFTSWAPIMGVGYYSQVTQWSAGDYPDANNKQDDLAILDGYLGYRRDDHGDTPGTASALLVDSDGTVSVTNNENDPHNQNAANKGIIEDSADRDVFYFDNDGGWVDLTVTPAWDAFYRDARRGANLDIKASLYDASGNLVAQSDPTDETSAWINVDLGSGRFYLSVTGVGNASSPYPQYGSLGNYHIFGSISGSGPSDSDPPNPDPMTWWASPTATDTTSITMRSATANDDSGGIQYYFACTSGCADSGWQDSPNYTASSLTPGTRYSFTVKARDAYGNQTAWSPSASATTYSADNLPPNPNPMSFSSRPKAGGKTTISMTATAANDASGGIQYYFYCGGCPDSGWQTSRDYTARSLTPGTAYFFAVKARDAHGNETRYGAYYGVFTHGKPVTPKMRGTTVNGSYANVLWRNNYTVPYTGTEVLREKYSKRKGRWVKGVIISFKGTYLSGIVDTPKRGKWRYRVRTYNDFGISAWSNPVYATVKQNCIAGWTCRVWNDVRKYGSDGKKKVKKKKRNKKVKKKKKKKKKKNRKKKRRNGDGGTNNDDPGGF